MGGARRRAPGPREWLAWSLVAAPLVLSVFASGYLVLALVFGDLGAVIGPAVGTSALTLWQLRPRATAAGQEADGQDGDDDEPVTRRSDGAFLAICSTAVLADLALLVVVPVTGRLPDWVAWAAGVLLVVHGALLLRAALAVRRRFEAPPPGYDAPPPPKRSLEPTITWRATPEPLRSLLVVAAVGVSGFVVALGAGFAIHDDALLGAFLGIGFAAAGLGMLLLGGCIALDVGDAADAVARRVADVQRSQGVHVAGPHVAHGLLLARLGGAAVLALGGLLLWVALLPV